MNDLTISLQMMLIAKFGVKPEPEIKDPVMSYLAKELLDYIHSKEYQQLIVDEQNNINKSTNKQS